MKIKNIKNNASVLGALLVSVGLFTPMMSASADEAKHEETKEVKQLAPENKAKDIYTVVDGDSLWEISHKNGMTVDELKSINKVGDQKLDEFSNDQIMIHPEDKIKIDENTKEDTFLKEHPGNRNTTPVVEQTVVKAPVKEAPAPVVQEAQPQVQSNDNQAGGDLSWLIARESSGNPFAENGAYKGIGQLSESYYQKYLGMSWSQVKGNYVLQEQAMRMYIADRYGSVGAAIAHWQANNWY